MFFAWSTGKKRPCDLPNSLMSSHLPHYSPSECYRASPRRTGRRNLCAHQAWNGSWNLRTLHKSGRPLMPVGRLLAPEPYVRLKSNFPLRISTIKHDPLCKKKVPEGQLGPTSIALLKRGQCVHPFFFIFRQ